MPEPWELEVHGVADPGVSNQERVYLRARSEVELGTFFLMTGWQWPDGAAQPLPESLWLGKLKVAEGYWIVVYTGPGEQRFTKLQTGEPCLVLHWGKSATLFNVPQIVPLLVQAGAVKIGGHIQRALTP